MKSISISSCFPYLKRCSLRFVLSIFDSNYRLRLVMSNLIETGLGRDGEVNVIFFMLAASSKESYILKTIGWGFWRFATSLALINSTLSL
jgi:hypothetical protein